jgi:tRNA-dihydrouridine synthase
MVGRGVLSNPWFFDPAVDLDKKTKSDKIKVLIRHLQLWNQTWGTDKNFSTMKKYYKIYIANFGGASELRTELMSFVDIDSTVARLEQLLQM